MLERLSAKLFGRPVGKDVKCRSGLLIEMMWVHEGQGIRDMVPDPGFRFAVLENWKTEDGRTICRFAMVEKDSLETGFSFTKNN